MRYRAGKVVTEAPLNCSHEDAWEKVCFYEHITTRPSWFLRTALPVPEKTTGRCDQPGDISRCCYSDGGYLTKRILKVVEDDRIEFGIIEQSIRFHRVVKLLGGCIQVEDLGNGRCVVRMTTHYETNLRPMWFFRWAIARVVKAMHMVVIKDMRACLAGDHCENDAVQLQV